MTYASKDQGFTLVEVLIAMFVFSLISVGTMTALTTTLHGQGQMNERLDDISEIELARALIKSDIANIHIRPVRDSLGTLEPYVLSGGLDSLLTFTRAGRSNPGGLETRSEFQRVSYVFEDGKLIRRSLAQVNPAPQTPTRDRVLLAGLADVSVEFRITTKRNATVGDETVSLNLHHFPAEQILVEPGQDKDLPSIVTFTTEFENGDKLTQHFEVSL